MTVLAKRIANSFVQPSTYCNPNEVYGYLLQCIGNLSQEELSLFLRFVTGSSVLCNWPIYITFTGSTRLARRPIAHCCTCMLELSSANKSFCEFNKEMKTVLAEQSSFVCCVTLLAIYIVVVAVVVGGTLTTVVLHMTVLHKQFIPLYNLHSIHMVKLVHYRM